MEFCILVQSQAYLGTITKNLRESAEGAGERPNARKNNRSESESDHGTYQGKYRGPYKVEIYERSCKSKLSNSGYASIIMQVLLYMSVMIDVVDLYTKEGFRPDDMCSLLNQSLS